MTWTQFHDMHSGGPQKLDWGHIWIEAPEAEAVTIFYNRFGRNPRRVTCTCCGEDYSLTESKTLEQATAYERNLRWAEDDRGWLFGKDRPADYREGRYLEPNEEIPEGMRVSYRYRPGNGITMEEFLAGGKTAGAFAGPYLIIRADEIKPEERGGVVPDEGYVWA